LAAQSKAQKEMTQRTKDSIIKELFDAIEPFDDIYRSLENKLDRLSSMWADPYTIHDHLRRLDSDALYEMFEKLSDAYWSAKSYDL
jgi:hypothetical protein